MTRYFLDADFIARDPLAAARRRGQEFALETYENPDNIAPLDAKKYEGRNERSLNDERLAGALYALLPPGKLHGFRYPKWQFEADRKRLAAALRPFVDVQANCWVIHSFMLRNRDELGGRTPAATVLDSKAELCVVVDLATRDLAGEQGAS